ncbi:MAG: deoxynucleoside kinase, partial [Cetobacterium sp.]
YYKNYFKDMKIRETSMDGIICIDGVVGVGKSTLGEILAEEFGIHFFREPVLNNPLLDKFYYDKKRYSFPLQVFFLNKRFEMIKAAEKLGGCVMDRSIYGDVIFAKMLMEDGDLSKEEFDIYEELLFNMLEHLQKPKLMIYLETTVDNAITKIQRRGRDYEQIVQKNYWENLNQNYSEYFESYNLSELLVINVDNLDIKDNPEHRSWFIDTVRERLALISK